MITRKDLLEKLINFEEPLEFILKELEGFGWDSKEDVVLLTRQHILHILKNYIENKINSMAVECWAEAIECREDIGYADQDLIKEIIWELANPRLTEKLTKNRAKILYDSLISAR